MITETFWERLQGALQLAESQGGRGLAMSRFLNEYRGLWPDIALSAAANPAFEEMLSRAVQIRDARIEEFLAIRKAEGLRVDAATADLYWEHGETLDPYGIYNLPDELRCIERNYFARVPGSNIWVEFGDLPEETLKALQKRDSSEGDDWLFDGDDDLPPF